MKPNNERFVLFRATCMSYPARGWYNAAIDKWTTTDGATFPSVDVAEWWECPSKTTGIQVTSAKEVMMSISNLTKEIPNE